MSKSYFPPQIQYIVGNEACERYSYYGMRSILVVFMVQHLAINKIDATAIYHLFSSLCYLLPLVGAYLADRYLGKYKTILYLSIIYCLGHLVLSLYETREGLMAGLFLIALGSGGIKPCVSAHVGDQFVKGEEHKVEKVFDLFYWMINFGSFFSTLITPLTLEKYGAGVAFGIPGILMAIATFIFWMGRKHYVHVPPSPPSDHTPFKIFISYLKGNLSSHPAEAVEGVKAVWNVGKLFLLVSVFWAIFDQSSSTWVLQAQQMNLNFMGISILPSQIQALNPILVLLLIPFFTFTIYPMIERLGFTMTPLRKMSLGMLIAGTSFISAAMIQFALDGGTKVNVAWQFVSYFLLTSAEVLISITGLEFAYTQAPRSMKSTIMSFWLMSVFVGNLFTAIITKLNIFYGGNYYLFFAGLTFVLALVFVWMSARYVMHNYMEGDAVTSKAEEEEAALETEEAFGH